MMGLSGFAEARRLPAAWPQRVRAAVSRFAVHHFAFPWHGLEDLLEQQGAAWLVGYGSLMHPASAARTIRDTPANGHPPVVAFGAKRLYEYIMPLPVYERYAQQNLQVRLDPRARAALNVRPTGNPDHLFNGRRIALAVADLDGLRQRERAYDLHPVAMLDWEVLDAEPQLGFALSCPATPYEGQLFVDSTLRPCPPYHRLCLQGAQLVSPEFAGLFLQTTYLGDGEQLVGPLSEADQFGQP